MKTVLLVLTTALLVAGGAYGRGWLDFERGKHPAVAAFEVFYWKLQRKDLEAAGSLVVPGSEAELELTAEREVGGVGSEAVDIARGFELELRQEADDEDDGRRVIRLYGEATVNIDPAGYVSAFGVPELHDVEARLVEDQGGWRVAAFSDLRR